MPINVTIYHNPRCSKSRAALEYLERQNYELTVVEYLKNPPSTSTLNALLTLLDLTPGQLVRKSEKLYKELGLANNTEQELLDAMAANPVLIERPIVTTENTATIGRPLDKVIEMLENHD